MTSIRQTPTTARKFAEYNAQPWNKKAWGTLLGFLLFLAPFAQIVVCAGIFGGLVGSVTTTRTK